MTGKELEQIYNEAYKAVYWTAMAFMKNEADAEDIVQDTFVALIESYDSIKDKSKVTSWLKKTAANKCLDRIKLSKTDTMEDEFFEGVEAVPEDFLPDSIVESEDARKIVMNIINNSLSDDIRRTLILFYFDEMSIKEIAVLLGVPEGTVSRRLNFARNKIKKEVEKYEKENDTKLYGMAIPFLTKLFMKEAEQVVFKPLPASLANLSASAEASKAGTNIAKTALKKGTDIMKTKILIGSAAAVVAVGATVGITIGVLSQKPEGKPVIEETTSVSEESEITEENGITEMNSELTTESVTEATSDLIADESATGDRWVDNNHFYINGKEIKVGLYGSTMQDIVDSGCYIDIWTNGNAALGVEEKHYTVDDEWDNLMLFSIYPDETSAASDVGGITLIVTYSPDMQTPYLIKDCVIIGFSVKAENALAWGDKLRFDFPLTMTVDQLKENSGDPDDANENGSIYFNGLSFWNFEFDENNQLSNFFWHQ